MATANVSRANLQYPDLQKAGEFLLFPFLPPEVQDMVWDEDVETERLVRNPNPNSERYKMEKRAPPIVLQVCKASRSIASRMFEKHHYQKRAWSQAEGRRVLETRHIYLHPASTILFESPQELKLWVGIGRDESRDIFRALEIKRIAIANTIEDTGVQIRADPDYRPRGHTWTNIVAEIIPRFLNLEELVIIKPSWANNNAGVRRRVNGVTRRMEETWRADMLRGAPVCEQTAKRVFNNLGIAASSRPSVFWNDPHITVMSNDEFLSSHGL